MPVESELYLRVKPGSAKNRIEKNETGWVVRISAPPVDGKANKALIAFLSGILAVTKTHIKIRNGQNSPYKRLVIQGMDMPECEKRLEAASR